MVFYPSPHTARNHYRENATSKKQLWVSNTEDLVDWTWVWACLDVVCGGEWDVSVFSIWFQFDLNSKCFFFFPPWLLSSYGTLLAGFAALAVSASVASEAEAKEKSVKKRAHDEDLDNGGDDEDDEMDEEEVALFEAFQKFFEFDDEKGYPKEVETLIDKAFHDLEAGSNKSGLDAFKQAVEMCKKQKGEKSPTVTLLLSGGMILGAMLGQHDAGIRYISEGLQIVRKNLGDKHPLVPVAYCYLALVEYSSQNANEFKSNRDKCMSACREVFGKDDSMTKEFENSFLELERDTQAPPPSKRR